MKIYISGKITGDHDYRAKFEKAADAITQFGHTPINPATAPDGLTNQDYMRLSFAEIDAADMVVFLNDWKDSAGAALERAYCKYIKKPFMEFNHFTSVVDSCGGINMGGVGSGRKSGSHNLKSYEGYEGCTKMDAEDKP